MIPQQLLSYVWGHREEDVRKLVLGSKQPPEGFAIFAALNAIQARQKLRLKYPEWYECPCVFIPDPVMVEQASSAEAAHYKSLFASPSGAVLDLGGSMGADSFAFA